MPTARIALQQRFVGREYGASSALSAVRGHYHGLNILFVTLLMRSGVEVLSSMPKLYWSDGCPPGREWLRLSGKNFGAD